DLVAGALGALGEGDKPVGRAVRRDDAVVMLDAKGVEDITGVTEGCPVRLAAHENGNGRRCLHHELCLLRRTGGADYSVREPCRKAAFGELPAQAMISGRRRSSIAAIRSLSTSLRFFMRWTWTVSITPLVVISAIAASSSRCSWRS